MGYYLESYQDELCYKIKKLFPRVIDLARFIDYMERNHEYKDLEKLVLFEIFRETNIDDNFTLYDKIMTDSHVTDKHILTLLRYSIRKLYYYSINELLRTYRQAKYR